MHDVPIREGSVLATQEARVLLIHEQAKVSAQPAVLVAQSFAQRRMRLHERRERIAQRGGVQRDVTRSAREIAVCAVEKYSHMSTTNGSCQLRHQISEDDARAAS